MDYVDRCQCPHHPWSPPRLFTPQAPALLAPSPLIPSPGIVIFKWMQDLETGVFLSLKEIYGIYLNICILHPSVLWEMFYLHPQTL